MCFSDNFATVKAAFSDYMNDYLTNVEGRKNLSYDNTVSFSEKETKVNELMKKEITKLAGVEFSEGSFVSEEMWASHPMLRWASFAVANSLIDMIIPDTLDRSIGIYTEQRYVKYGDSMSFDIEPNDLFYVSKAGRDQRTVEFQRQFAGQVTVIPENREITVFVNFYRVLCGLDSLAKFVSKAILSIETQITREVFSAFDAAMEELPSTPADGQLKVTGYSQTSAVRLAQTVSAFNNGAKAVFLGTQLALQNILPNDANYRYMLDSDYARLGYVKNAFGFDTMVIPQIADWKNPYKLALRDDRIYVVSPSSQKLVKLVYEGASRTNALGAFDAANLTETTTINKSWGIAVATNAVAGVITLA
jgi:hypothetical protein